MYRSRKVQRNDKVPPRINKIQLEQRTMAKKIVVRAFGARLLGGPAASETATQVLLGQNRLWNKLVEIERDARVAYRGALSSSDAELATLEGMSAALDEKALKLLEERNKARARARSKKSDADGDIPAQLRAIYAEQKTLRARMRERRVAAKEAAKPLVEAAEAARRQRVKDAVAEAGLWWGHSETVLAKYDVARVRAMKEGAELRFRRFEGEGSMGVRFTKDGGALDKIHAGATDLLRFREATPEELGHMKATKADGGRRLVFRVRAGSKGEDKSVPALEFLVTMHAGMELPEDLPLKTVTLSRKMHVRKEEWKVVLMFSDEVEDQPLPELPAKAAGIDLGWRLVKNEDSDRALRVAAISMGPDERIRYVNLGPDWMRRMDRADRLRGQLDDSANLFAARLLPLLTEEALATLDEGEWFRVIAGKAKRAKRAYPMLLIQVCEAHEKGGRPLGDEVNEMMSVWRREALKLATAAHHSRRRATDHRKHYFRNVAAQMVQQAGLIGVEDIDLRQLALRQQPDGTDSELVLVQRKYRTWAAPSELRLAIQQAAKRQGIELVSVDAKGTTTTCSACGHQHGGPIEDLMFVCEGCGKVWDQDENAAHNCRNLALKEQSSALTSGT